MICFIAWIVFAVLGVFSARYRSYFFEATDCLFRKVTLRKCTTSFDQKMKMKVSTKLAALNKSLGSFVFKHFETVSWIFTIIMMVSLAWSAYSTAEGIYNWAAFGNCYGPDSTQLCVLNTLTGKPQPTTPVVADYLTDNNLKCDSNLLTNSITGVLGNG